MTLDEHHARSVLEQFEGRLDPAQPTASDMQVAIVGYGEVSTVLSLAALPGWVCKRMAGFREASEVHNYLEVVQRYVALLERLGVPVATTVPLPVRTRTSGDIVYLLQPALDPRQLGNALLQTADDATLLSCLDRILEHLLTLFLANQSADDGRTVTVDAQLSNWHFPLHDGSVGAPTLIDVGTPFMRLHGIDEMGIDLFLAPVPAPLRPWYRRTRMVEQYIDDYFEPRKLFADLLGNFHKEGRPDRIPLALDHINRWLSGPGAALSVRQLTRDDVDRYYRKDAQLLELFLKVRRFDRFVRTRLLRQRYNFILPGPIRR